MSWMISFTFSMMVFRFESLDFQSFRELLSLLNLTEMTFAQSKCVGGTDHTWARIS